MISFQYNGGKSLEIFERDLYYEFSNGFSNSQTKDIYVNGGNDMSNDKGILNYKKLFNLY